MFDPRVASVVPVTAFTIFAVNFRASSIPEKYDRDIFPDCLYFDICTSLFDLRSIIIKFHTFKWNHIN